MKKLLPVIIKLGACPYPFNSSLIRLTWPQNFGFDFPNISSFLHSALSLCILLLNKNSSYKLFKCFFLYYSTTFAYGLNDHLLVACVEQNYDTDFMLTTVSGRYRNLFCLPSFLKQISHSQYLKQNLEKRELIL